MQGYDWLPTECADARFPMQMVFGALVCGDEVVELPMRKIVNNGWGEIGSRRIVEPLIKQPPSELKIEWFSFVEDCFYAGHLELPLAKLSDKFAAGFTEPGTGLRAQWSKLIVGMGFGGWVSLWLAGSGIVRAVHSAQVEAAELDWSLVLANPDIPRAQHIDSTLRQWLSGVHYRNLQDHGVPDSPRARYEGPQP